MRSATIRPGPEVPARAARLVALARAWLARAAARRRQRLDLAALDARLLRDIGLTREQAGAEAAKGFWRA
ncbi:MAG: DUF1127 domain-containing protein [Methylobacterium sp.]|uniref:DUF1127 domain-containing protein n=1 Tax=Methylobacterium sp. TaxID=409 RepID=UPI002583F999|nr:DUF1127 domain-containing protein [Methylobacterium sp.]MBY0295751.1 DUF1127 domain-containing protein [Methylobacterium sp.]